MKSDFIRESFITRFQLCFHLFLLFSFIGSIYHMIYPIQADRGIGVFQFVFLCVNNKETSFHNGNPPNSPSLNLH